MALLLNIRVLIALALVGVLGFSHFASYRAGKNHVTLQWKAATAAANIEASRFERQRQRGVDQAGVAAAKRSAGISADLRTNRAVLSGLRADLDAAERMAAQSHDSANNAVRTIGELLASCTKEYSDVAEAADRAYSEVKMLRDAWPR